MPGSSVVVLVPQKWTRDFVTQGRPDGQVSVQHTAFFSKESRTDVKTHVSGITSLSPLNTRLERTHLRPQRVLLGWAPRPPDAGRVGGCSQAALAFISQQPCAFYPFAAAGEHTASCRSGGRKMVVNCLLGAVCWGLSWLYVLRVKELFLIPPSLSPESAFFFQFC